MGGFEEGEVGGGEVEDVAGGVDGGGVFRADVVVEEVVEEVEEGGCEFGDEGGGEWVEVRDAVGSGLHVRCDGNWGELGRCLGRAYRKARITPSKSTTYFAPGPSWLV